MVVNMTDYNIENVLKDDATMRLPLLALRGLCVFSGIVLHFDVGRPKSVKALDEAMKSGQMIFLVAQKDMKTDNPQAKDLYTMGTVARVKQILRLPGDSIRVLVEGIHRAEIVGIISDSPFYEAEVKPVLSYPVVEDRNVNEALLRTARDVFDQYASYMSKLSTDITFTVLDTTDPGYLADYLAANLPLRVSDKQVILEELNPLVRLQKLISLLENEVEILDLEQSIHLKTKEQIDKNQKEYYLREQMKAIQNELGEGDGVLSDCEKYTQQILKLKLPADIEEKLLKEVDRLSKMALSSSEGMVIRTYLDTCLELPWKKSTKDRTDVAKAKKILEADHYGMSRVKERILEFLAVKKLNPELKGQIICLVGPPGVGKTSVGVSIAKALGRKYTRVSLGGVRDEADIRGHRKTYIGAMPGRIINALRQAKTNNPVILLDEVDKLSYDFRGDPSAALLEVLDPEQNVAFYDHYIELPFDLTNVLFITTANTLDTIPRPLLDRMEIIELSSYTSEEKLQIAKKYLLPKQQKKHGLKKNKLILTDEAIADIINYYTRESGVRNLERNLASVCRKSAMQIVEGKKSVHINSENLTEFLGPHKFLYDKKNLRSEVGVVCGLAWTQSGGDTLFVEVNVVKGTGKIELTGQLGEVMKESAHAAISFIRSRASDLGIEEEFYKDYDMHIHFPEGAIPKDGPSAGITMATAIISALTGIPVKNNVAMTGEITIRGRVLPIGGLREKSMAAYRAKIDTVIIPKENESDLEEIDQVVKDHITFIPVSTMDEVLKIALIDSCDTRILKPTAFPAAKAAPIPIELPKNKSRKSIQQ
jgi:ATP-dependent Lon protease